MTNFRDSAGIEWTVVEIAALDRIIVHRDLTIEAAGVHMSPAARRASDHLPIWARVSAQGE